MDSLMDMRTWTFPERRPPGDGPWTAEPDKAQWIDPATGLDCLIVRNRHGALCGYAGVPPEHPLHGVDYDSVDVDVHGGLTFSGLCQEGAEDGPGVCHVPAPGRPAKVWWLGFDCAHAGDVSPVLEADLRQLGLPPLPQVSVFGTTAYRTFPYVQSEVTGLAAQLAAHPGVTEHADDDVIDGEVVPERLALEAPPGVVPDEW